MKRTKIYAAYLPQFHEIPENNEFWGKGFTEWTNVKKAKPQFPGHKQPKVPANENYYDLSNVETIKWQADLAKKYGIDGFNIYHYWFKGGKKVLEGPTELLLVHKEIDISYFLTWDNCSWVRTWGKDAGNAWSPIADEGKAGNSLLLKMEYGNEEDWKEHFYYLKQYFDDPRYLKIDGKPVFGFMTENEKGKLISMCNYWRKLAVNNGYQGLHLISSKSILKKTFLDASFIYEPKYSAWSVRAGLERRLKKTFGIQINQHKVVKYLYSYDKVWKRILKRARITRHKEIYPGCFVSYDDSPRRGNQAAIITDASPDKMYHYLKKLYEICCNADKEIMIITAWNEWGEGAYLEPDTQYHFKYLEALRQAKTEVLIKIS